MAMQLGSPSEEDEVMSSINTTPLVDVMLVLLIIFLITIPVVTHTAPVQLPAERNQATQTKPENIIIAVNRDGQVFWNERLVPDLPTLFERMKAVAVQVPQPEIHIRGDQEVRYRAVGEVVVTCQRAGIVKIAFITEPPPRG